MAALNLFLSNILDFVRTKNAMKLRDWLRVEPPLPEQYYQLGAELKASYGNGDVLDRYVTQSLPTTDTNDANEGDVWPGFLAFVKEYLEFWRDVDFNNLLETHSQLSGLVNASITAMSNSSFGVIVLSTTIQLSTALAKLAMNLDKRPDLTKKLRVATLKLGGETRKSLVEGTAESIQRAFTVCLTERSASMNGVGKDGKPTGKKSGIYSFANLVLKLLFQCHKTRLANQLFSNISQNSPPLALYPASQRVTYLYYLGRFQFSNNHFLEAQECLQEAYLQCHARTTGQRRLILIHLITSNLILGRFPSKASLSRPESAGLLEKFAPVCISIRKGDLVGFKRALGAAGGNERWFFRRGLLLPLLSRAEILVWRSLTRRVFLLTYQLPSDSSSRKAPTLDLQDLLVAAQYYQKLMEGWKPSSRQGVLIPPQAGPITLKPNEGVIYGNAKPDLTEIEAIVASLVQQGFLHGYISHNLSRFAILGAKQRGGALNAGFPAPWSVIKTRTGIAKDVPGWIRKERKLMSGGVVNLSGIARPVGSD